MGGTELYLRPAEEITRLETGSRYATTASLSQEVPIEFYLISVCSVKILKRFKKVTSDQ